MPSDSPSEPPENALKYEVRIQVTKVKQTVELAVQSNSLINIGEVLHHATEILRLPAKPTPPPEPLTDAHDDVESDSSFSTTVELSFEPSLADETPAEIPSLAQQHQRNRAVANAQDGDEQRLATQARASAERVTALIEELAASHDREEVLRGKSLAAEEGKAAAVVEVMERRGEELASAKKGWEKSLEANWEGEDKMLAEIEKLRRKVGIWREF